MTIVHLVSWIAFSALLWRLLILHKRQFGNIAIWGFMAKVIGAISLYLVYKFYYVSGDTIALFDQIKLFNLENGTQVGKYANALFEPIDPHSGNPRSEFFVRLMSPLGWLLGGNYMALSISLVLFSYWTTWTFLTKTVLHYPKIRNLLLICFGFLPTYLFWSSGLLKDTVINGSMMFLVGISVEFYHRRKLKWRDIFIGITLFYLLFMTRHYLAGLLCIGVLMLLADGWVAKYGSKVRIVFFALISMLGAYGIRFFFIRLRPERFPLTFHELHEEIIRKSPPGSIIKFNLEPTWISLISNLPKSLWTGLFRPNFWEAQTILQTFASIQATLLFISFIISGLLIKKARQIPVIVMAMMLFVVILGSFLPLVSPNFGSLSRYRVAFTPFLAFLVLYLPFRQFVSKDL